MNRTTISLIAAGTALVAVTGFAALTAPDGRRASGAAAPARLPGRTHQPALPRAQRAPTSRDTTYTSFTPGTGGAGAAGSAELNEGAVTR